MHTGPPTQRNKLEDVVMGLRAGCSSVRSRRQPFWVSHCIADVLDNATRSPFFVAQPKPRGHQQRALRRCRQPVCELQQGVGAILQRRYLDRVGSPFCSFCSFYESQWGWWGDRAVAVLDPRSCSGDVTIGRTSAGYHREREDHTHRERHT